MDLKICFITLYITTLSIDTLMQRNRCSSWCSPQWNVRRFEMKLAVLYILFVSWWYRCLKCLAIIQRKKKMTWLCVNQTKHVIYSRLELKLCLRCRPDIKGKQHWMHIYNPKKKSWMVLMATKWLVQNVQLYLSFHIWT